MQNINLLDELEKAQIEFEQLQIIQEVESILKQESHAEQFVASRISGRNTNPSLLVNLSMLDQNKMFDLQSIEQLCTNFRLRFLDSKLFKGEIPAEAVREVKRIESASGLTFNRFKIIAPEERFNLADSTKDPILMAELPNGKYYYIFQWGNDLAWYQRILKYPFRHMGTLAASSLAIGLLIALLVPSQFADMKSEFFFRFFMFTMSSSLIMTLAIIVGIMNSKDFSENVWNSKYIK